MNTKISTIFKTSILAIAVLMIAFMFSACGGNGQFKDVKVDTKAFYVDSNAETVKQLFVNEEDPAEGEAFIIGLHASVDMTKTQMNPLTQQMEDINTNYNFFYKYVEDDQGIKSELVIKELSKVDGVKSQNILYFIINHPFEGEETLEFYVDINSKLNGETLKGKYKFNLDSEYFVGDSFMNTCNEIQEIIETFLPDEGSEFFKETNNYGIATDGTSTKIKVTVLNDEEEYNGTIYYVLENGKFDGIKVENLAFKDKVTLNMEMENWNGDIKYPNFDKFKEYAPVTA